MSRYVLDLKDTDKTQAALAGGKGANLGELTRIDGVRMPPGFVVTTDAFQAGIDFQVGTARPEVPADVAAAIVSQVARLGADAAYAVRSSATAEDSATASFAGQQDTYLDVVGPSEIVRRVRDCWLSLSNERSLAYRQHQHPGLRPPSMAVVVQRMVHPQAAGVLFTADPVTGNRKGVCVEAVTGLGDALVSGLVTPDTYQVRSGEVTARSLAGERQVLTDAQIAELAALGRRIEAHFRCPQDIEWCLADGEFQVVQSRPITTLFPVPVPAEGPDDQGNHVYVSVGHQQMMTDPIKPLGISVWQLTAGRPMLEAGGRLFVDVTGLLSAPKTRAGILKALGTSDPLIGDALQSVIDRGDFLPEHPEEALVEMPAAVAESVAPTQPETDPAIVPELIERCQDSIAALQRDIAGKSGMELLDFIRADIQGELKKVLFTDQSRQALVAGIATSVRLGERLQEWLGERDAVDALTQSVPYNVTSEMGLALMDVADAIRPHPDVVAFLAGVADDSVTEESGTGEDFLDKLPSLAGGREARDAIAAYLEKYGMRCVGEIDITRPRWSERPAALVPLILANVRNFEPGEGARRFERGLRNAAEKERELLARLRELPDGEKKAGQAKRLIDRVRAFIGYREYPKYHMISRYFLYKQALLREAESLVRAGTLPEKEDIFFLTFDELGEAVRTRQAAAPGSETALRIEERKGSFIQNEKLSPPRVLTSDGEAVTGRYRRTGVPDGALTGLPVSAGTVEGRARVVADLAGIALAGTGLEPGDILVTAFTDPSWTPVFTTVAGLVTEVGGLMTHGAVIAREYGLPAVVGVQDATRLIRDGQRIRLHGTAGYIELLP